MPLLLPDDDPCSFCQYLAGRRPYTFLHRDALVAVLVTREQRGSLHVLVIPVAHRPTLLDLREHEEAPLMAAVTRAVRAIEAATGTEGIAVWQNNGVPSHQSVPHVHVHVTATLPQGGTEWGQVTELSVERTDELAAALLPHWQAAERAPAAVPALDPGHPGPLTLSPLPPPARWLVASRQPWGDLVSMGPPGFEAYARLRFMPDPGQAGQSENDVSGGPDDVPELVQTAQVLQRLAEFTRTPDDCVFLLWEGMPDSCQPEGAVGSPRVELEHRSYRMLQGPLTRLDTWVDQNPQIFPPAFIWPADRRWCFVRDVDPHYAGIGAEAAAIDALLAEPGLDVVRADPDQPQPSYR